MAALPVDGDGPGRCRAGASPLGWRSSWPPRVDRCPAPSRPWRSVRRLALPVAVCSGSYGVVMAAALRRLGLEADVAAWHSAEFEPYGKPHPGAYITTAAKLGLDPTRLPGRRGLVQRRHRGQGSTDAGGRGPRAAPPAPLPAGGSATPASTRSRPSGPTCWSGSAVPLDHLADRPMTPKWAHVGTGGRRWAQVKLPLRK